MAMVLSGQSAARALPATPAAINPAITERRERSPMPSPVCGSLTARLDRGHLARAGVAVMLQSMVLMDAARCHSFRTPPQHDQHDGAGDAQSGEGDSHGAE